MKDKDVVFMVMPFGDKLADTAYNHITKPVVESFNLSIFRADEIFSTNPIFDDIKKAIEQAAIVIVDISGKNSNCFYELGISHTLKKSRTIMITHDNYDEMPFDISHFRIIQYRDSIEGHDKYREDLKKTIHAILTGVSELYHKDFSLIAKTLRASGKQDLIHFAIGIAKTRNALRVNDPVDMEGTYRGIPSGYSCAMGELYAKPLLELGYLTTIEDKLSLTETGQSFVGFLEKEGYVTGLFNGEKLVEGYKSFFEEHRMIRKRAEHPEKS